jgi:hypothetical protein
MQCLSAALHGLFWVHIFAMLFRRAVLTLWHAFLFLKHVPSVLLFAWWFPLPCLAKTFGIF